MCLMQGRGCRSPWLEEQLGAVSFLGSLMPLARPGAGVAVALPRLGHGARVAQPGDLSQGPVGK